MKSGRLEAFSDGVIAILITIMVLELHVPHGAELSSLTPLIPPFLTYLLSFAYLGIYWNNHHHMFQTVKDVNGSIMWANLHLLFWLSLMPFATGWMGENSFAPIPTAIYGVVLLMSAVAYTVLQTAIIRHQGRNSTLAKAVGKDAKGKVSALLCLTAIPLAFVSHWVSELLYILVAVIWFIPDSRIEKRLEAEDDPRDRASRLS